MKANKRQLADVFGVDEDTITNWQKEANFPPYEKRIGRYGSIYDTAAVIRWRMGNGDDANERLKRLQGDKVEIELAAMRGDLIPRAVIERQAASTGGAVRNRILAVEAKVAPLVDVETLAVIKRAHIEALEEMSSDEFISRVEHESLAPAGDDAAAGSDAEPVGGSVPKAKRRGKRRARPVEDE